jgi:hypothetical protein
MAVLNAPSQLATPEGPTYIDLQSVQSSTYTTVIDTTVSDYTWTVEPDAAWQSISSTDHEMEVIWATEYMGEANIRVQGSNICGAGPVSENLVVVLDNTTSIDDMAGFEVKIYPNPNSGIFKLNLSTQQTDGIKLSIRNMLGEIIISDTYIPVNGQINQTFNLEAYAEGIYFLVIDNGEHTRIEKIVLQK